MSAELIVNPLRYKGSSSAYVDVAVRGTEHLGVSLGYVVHPVTKVGCFILRFVVHGEGADPKNYKHFTYRERAKFVTVPTGTDSAELFKGYRLNKMAIPAFDQGVHEYELDKFATIHNTWFFLAKWVGENIAAEGFTVNVDLENILKTLVIPPATPEESVGNVLNFPDLTSAENQKSALKLVKKPVEDEDEEDTDEEDGDEDEEKDWLN